MENKKRSLNQLIEKNALLFIIVSFVVIILIKVILSLKFYAPIVYMDEFIYDSLARNILEGKLYAIGGCSHPPGYPVFLSLAYLLSPDKSAVYHIMLAISAVFTTSIIFPSYFMLKKYCSAVNSLLGALAITTLPFLNYYSFTIMTEALFIPLFLYSAWFLLKSYETNDKKWELLASLSVVYLYITRSNGLAMLIAFVLAFVYYVIVNSKNNKMIELIKKKSFLITSFIIFLSLWLIFSTYITDINKPISDNTSTFNFGSSYSIINIIQHLLDVFQNIVSFINGIIVLIYHIDYTILVSYSLLLAVIFFGVTLYLNNKIAKNNPLCILSIYYAISLLLLIFSTVGFAYSSKEHILGRYIDPVIPLTIIFGIIIISNINYKIISTKNTLYFTIAYISILAIVLYTLVFDDVIIIGFGSIVNNPSLYPFRMFFMLFYGSHYGLSMTDRAMYILPIAVMALYFLIVLTLIYLSIENKRYISVLLIIIIISSIILSSDLYNTQINFSNGTKGDPIASYLMNNTNKNTIFLVDNYENKSYIFESFLRTELSTFGYWNKGNTEIIDAENMTYLKRYGNNTTYLVSTKSLPYKEVLKDGKYKLYIL